MEKDAPNHVPINMIGLAQTSRKILKDGDVPIFPVVLITPDSLQLTVIVPVSHYLPSVQRLIQYVYNRTFIASVQHMINRLWCYNFLELCVHHNLGITKW